MQIYIISGLMSGRKMRKWISTRTWLSIIPIAVQMFFLALTSTNVLLFQIICISNDLYPLAGEGTKVKMECQNIKLRYVVEPDVKQRKYSKHFGAEPVLDVLGSLLRRICVKKRWKWPRIDHNVKLCAFEYTLHRRDRERGHENFNLDLS